MKYEWKKNEKHLYGIKQTPELVDVPSQKFIMIQGAGNPNEADFSDRISTLYSLAYSIKILFKFMMKNESDDKITDFTVYPLEGIWEKTDEDGLDKDKLKYTLMIKQPDFITQEIFLNALENIQKKKPSVLYNKVSFGCIDGGKAIQILHIVSYDTEPASCEKMDKLTKELGVFRCSDSHR